jgi:hypothetical protein
VLVITFIVAVVRVDDEGVWLRRPNCEYAFVDSAWRQQLIVRGRGPQQRQQQRTKQH